jgi:hypothetical protein
MQIAVLSGAVPHRRSPLQRVRSVNCGPYEMDGSDLRATHIVQKTYPTSESVDSALVKTPHASRVDVHNDGRGDIFVKANSSTSAITLLRSLSTASFLRGFKKSKNDELAGGLLLMFKRGSSFEEMVQVEAQNNVV